MVLLSCPQHWVCKLAQVFRLDCFSRRAKLGAAQVRELSKFLSFGQTEFHIFQRHRFAFAIRPERQFTGEMRLTADLINSSLSYLNPNKERELDLRGAFLKRADTTL